MNLTKTKKQLGKIFTWLLTIGICFNLMNFTLADQVMAQDQDVDGQSSAVDYTSNDNKSSSSTKSFKVNDYLKVDDQKQSYFEGESVPIAAFVLQVINFITLIIGSASLLAIIIGGFLLLTSHGSENQVTKGKDAIKYAVIGLVITFSAYFIVSFVQNLLYAV